MRQAQQLQAKLEKAQEELERTTVEASSGGGAITVVITGGMKVESVKISPEVVDAAEVEMLEDLVLTAVNEAIRKSQEMASSQLGKITGGLKIPGL
jgi:DNA-binding YbaB/EbfC family protein